MTCCVILTSDNKKLPWLHLHPIPTILLFILSFYLYWLIIVAVIVIFAKHWVSNVLAITPKISDLEARLASLTLRSYLITVFALRILQECRRRQIRWSYIQCKKLGRGSFCKKYSAFIIEFKTVMPSGSGAKGYYNFGTKLRFKRISKGKWYR